MTNDCQAPMLLRPVYTGRAVPGRARLPAMLALSQRRTVSSSLGRLPAPRPNTRHGRTAGLQSKDKAVPDILLRGSRPMRAVRNLRRDADRIRRGGQTGRTSRAVAVQSVPRLSVDLGTYRCAFRSSEMNFRIQTLSRSGRSIILRVAGVLSRSENLTTPSFSSMKAAGPTEANSRDRC